MNFIKQLNLKEIEYLANKLSIVYNAKNSYKFSKGISSRDIFEATEYIKNEVWNQKNVQIALAIVRDRTSEEILYYYPPSEPEPIDGFLEKAGILNYKVAMTDPLSLFVNINPNFEDAPHKNPLAWSRVLVENSLLLISLAPWITTNQLILLPDLRLWDYKGWLELARMNKEVRIEYDLKNSDIGREVKKIFALENAYRILSAAQRSSQKHYKLDDIKKILGINDDQEAEKYLKTFKSMPKHERDLQALMYITERYGVNESDLRDKIERYKARQIFDIENYININGLDVSFDFTSGMNLNMPLYIGDKLNVIPITDHKLHKLTFDMFTQVISLKEEYKQNKELVESKIDLDLPFMKNFSPEFIAKQKESGAAQKLKKLLDNKWVEIKTSTSPMSYKLAMQNFSEEIKSDYKILTGQYEHLKQQALANIGKTITGTTGVFIEGVMNHSVWYAIGQSLVTLMGGAIITAKSHDKKKFELKKNPLFIFLEKKNIQT